MSSALNAARATIEGLVQTAWLAAGNTADTIQWANTNFVPPATAQVYIQPTILWGGGARLTVGAVGSGKAQNQVAGVLSINVFVRAARGTGAQTQAADTVRDMVNRLTTGGIRFDVPAGPKPVPSGSQAWEQANVWVAFYVDEAL